MLFKYITETAAFFNAINELFIDKIKYMPKLFDTII